MHTIKMFIHLLKSAIITKEVFICLTGDEGMNSCRPRYFVKCLICNKVLHENTTGPLEHIEMFGCNIHINLEQIKLLLEASEQNAPK